VHCFRAILNNNGYTILQTEVIAALSTAVLVACDCETYLHYAWCYHALSVAFSHSIITSFPKNKDPGNIASGNARGRPPNAKHGDALNNS
jgi:hypothetical protein